MPALPVFHSDISWNLQDLPNDLLSFVLQNSQMNWYPVICDVFIYVYLTCVAAGHVNMGLRFAAVFAFAGGLCKALHQSQGSILPMPMVKHREQGSFNHYNRYFGPNAPADKLPPPGYN